MGGGGLKSRQQESREKGNDNIIHDERNNSLLIHLPSPTKMETNLSLEPWNEITTQNKELYPLLKLESLCLTSCCKLGDHKYLQAVVVAHYKGTYHSYLISLSAVTNPWYLKSEPFVELI